MTTNKQSPRSNDQSRATRGSMDSSRLPSPQRGNETPFEELPNLPKPIIPQIDLNIQRIDITGMLKYKPSITLQRKVGYSVRDHATQTKETEMVDLQHEIDVLQILVQDAGKLRKDLTFATNMLRASYDQQIKDRSTELYCRVNEKMHELEKQNKTKINQLRKSFQMQLDNAIHRIAGEYKAYYNSMLAGKAGFHDTAIEELKKELSEKDLQVRQQQVQIENLEGKLKEQMRIDSKEPSVSPIPVGMTEDEAEVLNTKISCLENELDSVKMELATQEDENKTLKKQLDKAKKHLEEQKQKYSQLEKDSDSYKKKMTEDQEKATKMAENRLAVLEKEMKEKMESATKQAMQKAQEQADMQRMKEQAKFQEEIERRKAKENELLLEANKKPTVVGDKELMKQLQRLQELEQQQKSEIQRLNKELERVNKVWELKMAVMKKNFQALKNELHLRHTLERQSVHLHHATVGYASSGRVGRESVHIPIVPEQNTQSAKSGVRPPTRLISNESKDSTPVTEEPFTRSKSVHFDETKPITSTQPVQA